MLFAFFLYTQAFLGAYLRQFLNLLIETFISVILVGLMVGLLTIAALQGIGLYIGASLITAIVLTWRILSALKLASAAFDLFGGGLITGGAGGRELATLTGKTTAVLAGAALTGGATLAIGGTALTTAALLRADHNQNGALINSDPDRTEGRVRQLQTIAGYGLGRSQTVRRVIENSHEMRTLVRNFRDGESQQHAPDTLDYFRAGTSMSGFGSSPWLAMRLSPSLRTAFDEIGGNPGYSGHPAGIGGEIDGVPMPRGIAPSSRALGHSPLLSNEPLLNQLAGLAQAIQTLNQNLQNGIGQAMTNPVPTVPTANIPATGRSATATTPPQTPSLATTVPTPTRSTISTTNVSTSPTSLDSNTATSDPVTSNMPASATHRQQSSEMSASAPPIPPPPSLSLQRPPIPLRPDEIRLEKQTPANQARQQGLIASLADPHSVAGEYAHETIAVYAGNANAQQIQEAVQAHGVEAVQTVATHVANTISEAQAAGQSSEEILTDFQQGGLQNNLETPLTLTQTSAVADMVMLPKRIVTLPSLLQTMHEQAQQGDISDRTLAQTLGSPTHFGSETGNLRALLTQLNRLQLSNETISALQQQTQRQAWAEMGATLQQQGLQAQEVTQFIQNLTAIPRVLQIPQTTAQRSDS
jgi:hypothetical protein